MLFPNHVIRDLVSEIRGGFFSIICDEYTDISNKEQVTICIRWVDKELQAHEDFFGFYNVSDNGAETMVSAIKDVLLKLQLLNNYWMRLSMISWIIKTEVCELIECSRPIRFSIVSLMYNNTIYHT